MQFNQQNSNAGIVTINGRRIEVPNGCNVSIINGTVFVDGKPWDSGKLEGDTVRLVIIEGRVGHLSSDASIQCGDVEGNVQAGGSVNCHDVSGNVNAGGSARCERVGGSIDAGGSVKVG